MIALPGSATAVSVGENHACAVLASGAVLCWGANHSGELGITGVETNATATAVSGFDAPITQVAAGEIRSLMAATGAQQVVIGGDDEAAAAALWEQYASANPRPFAVRGFGVAVQIALYSMPCVVTDERRLLCLHIIRPAGWDWFTEPELTFAMGEIEDWGGGAADYVALATGGGARVYGVGAGGEVRTGTGGRLGIDGAVAVSAGAHQACALLGDGRVACWGENDHGQTGSFVQTCDPDCGAWYDECAPRCVPFSQAQPLAFVPGFGGECDADGGE